MTRGLSNARERAALAEAGVDPARSNAPSVAFLALGSNLGDRRSLMREGARRLAAPGDLRIEAASALYASAPVDAAGGEFLNAVLRVRTTLSPRDLLRRAKDVERDLGRTGSRGDARPLDVDVLYFGDEVLPGPDLVVPHPRRMGRPFVLVPLSEVCGDAPEPGTGGTVAGWIADGVEAGRAALRQVEGPGWMDGVA